MKTNETNLYRQGDVLIERMANIPTAAAKRQKSARIILAHGEVTGHHHALETESPVEWFTHNEASSLSGDANPMNELFVSLPSGGLVVHPEHSALKLSAGNYRVVRQREYSPEAPRNVED